MRLHRALFYILLTIFVAGMLMAIFVDPSKVMSRIATGLITGSFVGLISTIVNYSYAWQTYFRNLYNSIFEFYEDLGNELIHAKVEVSYIESFSKQYLIDSAKPFTEDDAKKLHENQHKFDKYRIKLDDAPYAPLFFSKDTVSVLDELYNFTHSNVFMIFSYSSLKDSFVCLQECHFMDEEEERIAIGNKDDFFDYIVQNMYNWRDYTAHCQRRLVDILVAIQQSLKPFNVGKGYDEIPKMLSDLVAMDLKDIPNRNPMDEKTLDVE